MTTDNKAVTTVTNAVIYVNGAAARDVREAAAPAVGNFGLPTTGGQGTDGAAKIAAPLTVALIPEDRSLI